MKILVVDDDKAVRESINKVLRDAGYEVVLAADGQEAWKHFDPDQIGLVLLDLDLPVCGGWETFERITADNPSLPIIVITGHTEQFDVAVQAGVGAFMEKPLDVPRLLQTMRDLLAEPKDVRFQRLCGHRRDVRHIRACRAEFLEAARRSRGTPFHPLHWGGDGPV